MLRTRSNFLIGAAALGGLALGLSSAEAQVQDQTLRVEATVGEVCTVTAALLNFGTYAGAQLTESGSIEIDCITPQTLNVVLDGGQAGNGNGLRTMRNGAIDLAYTLYSDAPGGDPWETGEGVQATISGTGTVPVHGVITPVGQPDAGNLIDGVYSDEVIITLTF